MADYKKNTIAGQYEEYLKKPLESFLDWIRVPQQGEPGYQDISKELSARYPSKTEETVMPTPETPVQPLVPNSPLALAENKQEMNPIVKDYISKKIQVNKAPIAENAPTSETLPLVKKPDYLDKFNDEAYAKAKADSESRQDGLGYLQFLSGFGDALAQRNPSESAKNFDKIRANIKDETVGQFQRDKAQAVEDFKNKQTMNAYNPDSDQSIAFRKMIEAKFPDVAKSYGKMWNQVSAADKENIFEPLKLKESIEARKEQTRIQNQYHQEMLDMKKAELLKKNSPEERVKNLSSSDKARFDNALMVLKGIDDMGTALDNGQNTFSVIGDNDYTAASRRATEAYGRMQSGGAINKEEEKRFEATLPTSKDAKEMQRSKLLKQRDEMLSRLRTLGFTPEQIGYEPRNFNYGSAKTQSKPKQIIQNGHTYILNESTGEYE